MIHYVNKNPEKSTGMLIETAKNTYFERIRVIINLQNME